MPIRGLKKIPWCRRHFHTAALGYLVIFCVWSLVAWPSRTLSRIISRLAKCIFLALWLQLPLRWILVALASINADTRRDYLVTRYLIVDCFSFGFGFGFWMATYPCNWMLLGRSFRCSDSGSRSCTYRRSCQCSRRKFGSCRRSCVFPKLSWIGTCNEHCVCLVFQ